MNIRHSIVYMIYCLVYYIMVCTLVHNQLTISVTSPVSFLLPN